MNWTPLTPIGLEEWFGAKLRTTAGELNEAIGPLLEERARLDETVARVKGEDAAVADLDNTVLFPAFQSTRLTLLQREIDLRRRLAEFWGEYFAACGRAAEKAIDDHRNQEERTRKALEDLGYHPFSPHQPDPVSLIPAFIQRHPHVRAARDQRDALRQKAGDGARQQANLEALEQITREIDRAVARGLAG